MKYKKTLGLFVLLLLFLNIFAISGVAQTDYFIISENPNLGYDKHMADNSLPVHFLENNFLVDTNGYYYIWTWNDTSPYNFTLFKSTDSGDNWVETVEFNMGDDGDKQPDGLACYINDDDVIHLAYFFGDGDGFNVSYRNYNTGTDTISSKTHIIARSNNYHITGIAIAENDNGEIGLFWIEDYSSFNGVNLNVKVYNDQAEVWGDTKNLKGQVTAGDYNYKGLSVDILSNNSFVFSFLHRTLVPSTTLQVGYYDYVTDYTEITYTEGVGGAYGGSVTDIAVDSNDDIHVVCENNVDTVYYSFWNGTEYGEDLNTDGAFYPQIAINSDDTVQVVMEFDNAVTPSDWIGGYYGSYGSWSDLQYYVSGSTDNMLGCSIPYQNLQDFVHLTDGVIGYYYNDTDDNFVHFDEGYELFYGGSDYDFCVANYSYITTNQGNPAFVDMRGINDQYTTLEWYKQSFAEDVTLQCFELFVGNDQLTLISDDSESYLLYINGISYGNPNHINYDANTLSWYGLNQYIDNDDMLFEVVCGAGAYLGTPYIYYWKNLPLDKIGSLYYSSYDEDEIGNGEIDGTIISAYDSSLTGRGLRCIISYDVGSSVDECNAITITPISDFNLTAYEYYRANINIIGSDLSLLEIFNNDTGHLEGSTILSGNQNINWKWLIMPQNVETGNYSIRIAEIGCTDYVWDEFYINLTGFTSDDWDLSVSDSSVTAGTDVWIDFKAPDGETASIEVAMGYEVFPSIDLGLFAGTGDWVEHATKYTPFQDITIFLINETSEEIMKFIPISVLGEDNYIYVHPKELNIGETVYFDGTYTNNVYTFLRIISPSGVHYGVTCYQNVIDWEFKPDETGSWRYEVLQDGVVQTWSKGTFTVNSEGEAGTWYGLPYWVPYLIGIFLTLVITMSPLIIATYITRHTSYKKIDIPNMLYVGFFYTGLFISVAMSFLPAWLPFVILFVMIIYFAIQWLYGKRMGVEGE